MDLINKAITGSREKSIGLDLFFNKDKVKAPLVIFCHGYKGFKDWGNWNDMAKLFTDAGFNFLKFNFSYNGTSINSPQDFVDLEGFSDNNYITELSDLDKVLSWLHENYTNSKLVDVNKCYVIGHSRGGGIVTIKASEDSRIKKVISWAGVSDFHKRIPSKEGIEQWRKDGVIHEYNSRTKQQMPIKYQFYESLKENWSRLNIGEAAKQIKIPHLILHGADDKVVTTEEANYLKKCNPKAQIAIINDTAHTFDTKHPELVGEIPIKLMEVVSKTINFIK